VSFVRPSFDEWSRLRRAAACLAANPFTPERAALDLALADGVAGEPMFERALGKVEATAAPCLLREGRRALAPSEVELAVRAYLFAAFHRFVPAMTEHARLEASGEASKTGDVAAPFAPALIEQLETHGVESARAERVVALFYQTQRAFLFLSQLRGPSPSMQALRASLWNAVFTHDLARYESALWDRMEDFSTLLLGETGTGKGAAASAIGRAGIAPFDRKRGVFSPRAEQRFVAANLAEVPETLIESTLFGHEKGAFTGAISSADGLLSRVPKHGVIFLDELGDVPLHVQVKLLRVLQERTFTPVGGKKAKHFPGRVIAATHRSIDRLRQEGRFRDDLYYRLSTEAIVVPPLRMRIAESKRELPELVSHVVERTVNHADPELSGQVLEAIERDIGPHYGWPGNVRELEQCVRRVLLTGRCGRDVATEPRVEGASSDAVDRAADLSADAVLAKHCARLYEVHQSYEAVAAIVRLDRRTVKKHVLAARTSS
jgi:DNA-binding NtrC family response regulator